MTYFATNNLFWKGFSLFYCYDCHRRNHPECLPPKTHVRLFSIAERFLKIVYSRPLFLHFRLFNTVEPEFMSKISQMTGFEPRTSGVGSDRFTNLPTTIGQKVFISIFLNHHPPPKKPRRCICFETIFRNFFMTVSRPLHSFSVVHFGKSRLLRI